MATAIGYEQIVRMIRGGLEAIRAHHEELSRLDSALGDGDHGSAMLRAVEAAGKAIQQAAAGNTPKLLQQIAWGLMAAAGGAPGPLFGSFFLGMSEAADEGEMDAPAVAAMFEAGLAKLRKQTKAQPGEKTMVDALVPAVEALRGPPDVAAAMARAAEAAAQGAESTRDMQAKHGKARHMGERTLGHIDPGSMSVTYLFQGFAEGVARGS
ncbi:MAG TPA: dihydroxyacetone kinase subunit DhaL [Phycisphaerae bacterium]|nr:dihydroxyacetone kinase subunit DhaL [Phycisphaerae bacterium]